MILAGRAFAQIGVITRVRNDIVHYGSTDRNGVQIVSNARTAHTERSLRETVVSAKDLVHMTSDLVRIGMIFMHELKWGETEKEPEAPDYRSLAGAP